MGYNKGIKANIKRAEQIEERLQDTDALPSVSSEKIQAVSFSAAAGINGLIHRGAITLWINAPGTHGSARVKTLKPSPNKGFLLVECSTIKGTVYLEVGGGYRFEMRFQIP